MRPLRRFIACSRVISFRDVDVEDLKLRKHLNRAPGWFLLVGVKNRRALARAIGRESEYLSFYSEWSGFSHAADAASYITAGRYERETAFWGVRTPEHRPHRAFFAVYWLLRATRQMIEHFAERLVAIETREARRVAHDKYRKRRIAGLDHVEKSLTLRQPLRLRTGDGVVDEDQLFGNGTADSLGVSERVFGLTDDATRLLVSGLRVDFRPYIAAIPSVFASSGPLICPPSAPSPEVLATADRRRLT